MTLESTERSPGQRADGAMPVAHDVAGLRVLIANLYFVGAPGSPHGWVLVDTGVGPCADMITRAAEERFGPGARPTAILLTHGHFDHVGAVQTLAERWDVPVYAHEMELPYLTGRSDYPPADPTVGGGAMAWLSFMYPRRAINLDARVVPLPADGSVPPLPGWRAVHTHGHTPGHVSLFRESDRVLIAGDAVVTTHQESAISALTQSPQEVWRPPAYMTTNWINARRSVVELAALNPSVIATGHGQPMRGAAMEQQLQTLAYDFLRIGLPARGRYVREPAIADENGIEFVPSAAGPPIPKIVAGLALAAAGYALWSRMRRGETAGS
ncbi:MAG: MBL fold metallo-hydrolase [Armatimonadetes bacterium]|nr:MBL fold metallo-hydrolase [Armatimonadota bacterium]